LKIGVETTNSIRKRRWRGLEKIELQAYDIVI
jgi:hypothetical protein